MARKPPLTKLKPAKKQKPKAPAPKLAKRLKPPVKSKAMKAKVASAVKSVKSKAKPAKPIAKMKKPGKAIAASTTKSVKQELAKPKKKPAKPTPAPAKLKKPARPTPAPAKPTPAPAKLKKPARPTPKEVTPPASPVEAPAYQVVSLVNSCTIFAIQGSAAEFVKGRTVHWSLGSSGSPDQDGFPIAQAKGDPWFRILTHYLSDEAIPQAMGGVERFVAFSNEDTSGWSLIAVYEQGRLAHAIEWGLDYLRTEEGILDLPDDGPGTFALTSGDDLIKYRGPLDKAVAVGADTNAIISALCAAIGIRVVGDEYFGPDDDPGALAEQFAYYGNIDLVSPYP